MPHLLLEYTENLTPVKPLKKVFLELHFILSDHGIAIKNCKSRANRLETYLVSNGDTGNAFVHLDVRFLTGRSEEIKTEIGSQMLGVLKRCFPGDKNIHLQITLEIRDIERHHYLKFPDNLK